eukprot:CAMPEP_0198704928 /NCGR_PEP_ID=MMETSP1468-20131203/390162_1 /TAXON_ID=1461545 /ORGANISM="Mantoniella sp, Strain CCMP1436" /LENGTH=230 /DNA_ID=CAMNT_0044463769 /DNA_START=923 /DNA_END=1616 /DNA_ORIENTATION=+
MTAATAASTRVHCLLQLGLHSLQTGAVLPQIFERRRVAVEHAVAGKNCALLLEQEAHVILRVAWGENSAQRGALCGEHLAIGDVHVSARGAGVRRAPDIRRRDVRILLKAHRHHCCFASAMTHPLVCAYHSGSWHPIISARCLRAVHSCQFGAYSWQAPHMVTVPVREQHSLERLDPLLLHRPLQGRRIVPVAFAGVDQPAPLARAHQVRVGALQGQRRWVQTQHPDHAG